ncbi:type VI secretion-associated protein, family [Hartmannibacter diazotrophicus]|uniref:Type VI secretion-associated protein, family n=1 Tax=Hartmannibacter diazotrophicus TaxID=1482074 RepID=A0A2C9D8K3_9HYPH|nr:type VI secretion system-associated protein TagF [Hartmannibacter diazotrophicus]SON55885.1 type VI secretion-associated protein, family [Hartmannibacter diazotrophicus]
MAIGLFGKLPVKRDFIAINIPQPILEPWEKWLQQAVAASRHQLGNAWQDLYLTMPIWRFRLGRKVLGSAACGAIMPSVDGVGRFFPLSLLALGEGEQEFALPMADRADDWFEAAEAAMLTALDQEAPAGGEAILSGIPSLPPLAPAWPQLADLDQQSVRGALLAEGEDVEEVLMRLTRADHLEASAARSYWWSSGGDRFGAMAFCCSGLPDPYGFVSMMNGTGQSED